jgi:precorrin-6B methylase 2
MDARAVIWYNHARFLGGSRSIHQVLEQPSRMVKPTENKLRPV